MLNKQQQQRWDLRSRWMLRPQPRARDPRLICLIEHEVTVSSERSGLELVARFVHLLAQVRTTSRPTLGQGGLVSLVIRSRQQLRRRQRVNIKRLDSLGAKSLRRDKLNRDRASPQSRVSGSSSPVNGPLGLSSSSSLVPVASAPEVIKEDIGSSPALPSPATILPDQNCPDIDQPQAQQQAQPQPQQHSPQAQQQASDRCPSSAELPADANAAQTSAWLRSRRFHAFESTFASFSASDILRLSRDDLIQICGLADGIRLFNALHAKAPQPKLSLYFALEAAGPGCLWRAVYLDGLTLAALTTKLVAALGLPRDRLHSILVLGPQGIHVLVTNDLIANIKDESMFLVETINEAGTDRYKLLLKPFSH